MSKVLVKEAPVAELPLPTDERYEQVEIKWNKKIDKLIQIHSSGFAFCWATKNLEQNGVFVHCKDYLQDAVLGYLTNKLFTVYGYTYNPETDFPIDSEAIHLLIRNDKDESFQKKIPLMLEFLNQFESELDFEHSTIKFCSNSPGGKPTYLLEGDKRWMISSPMLSLYCLLTRVSGSHNKGETFRETINAIIKGREVPMSVDTSYLTQSMLGINFILENKDVYKLFGDDWKKNYEKGQGIHNAGIVYYSGLGKNIARAEAYAIQYPGKPNHMAIKPYGEHWLSPAAPADFNPTTY